MNHTTSGCVCAVRVQCVWFEYIYIYTYPHISRKLYSTCVHTTHAVYACKYIFNVHSGLTVVKKFGLSAGLARSGCRDPYGVKVFGSSAALLFIWLCSYFFCYRVVVSGHRGLKGDVRTSANAARRRFMG